MLLLLYLLAFTAHSANSFAVKYGKVVEDTPCVHVLVPVNGTNDERTLDVLQNIETRAAKHLQGNKTRECYMTIDTKDNQMGVVSRLTVSIVGIPLTSVLVGFVDKETKQKLKLMYVICWRYDEGFFECESSSEVHSLSKFPNMTEDLKAYHQNKLPQWAQAKLTNRSNNTSTISAVECTPVPVPDGETENYLEKLKVLEAFGERQIFGDGLTSECLMEYDTKDWTVVNYDFTLDGDGGAVVIFLLYSWKDGEDLKVAFVEISCQEVGGPAHGRCSKTDIHNAQMKSEKLMVIKKKMESMISFK